MSYTWGEFGQPVPDPVDNGNGPNDKTALKQRQMRKNNHAGIDTAAFERFVPLVSEWISKGRHIILVSRLT